MIPLFAVSLLLVACRPTTEPIIITATFPPPNAIPTVQPILSTPIPPDVIQPSPDPTRPQTVAQGQTQYAVQPGDTLTTIAIANNVTVDMLVQLNDIDNPNLLTVGQVLQLPAPPSGNTPSIKLLSDTRFVRTGAALPFDVASFIAAQRGYIRIATDNVDRSLPNGFRVAESLTAAQVLDRVSREYSVDPRVLLTLLELESNWLSQPNVPEDRRRFPLNIPDENREGMYRQLAWAADQLNRAFYDWQFGDLQIIQFSTGERRLYDRSLNAATVAIQYQQSLTRPFATWETQLSAGNFLATYAAYFGDPFVDDMPLIPVDFTQPQMQLPFAEGETWFYTGGPHGGWGNGSAWAAIDLAPPDERTPTDPACYTSAFPTRAVADGVIVEVKDNRAAFTTRNDEI
ncbi:MAG: LysM peptidoglycan-binding domain-containing protein, partial [Chloroflexota bacterium]